MIRLPRYGLTYPEGRKSDTFEYPNDDCMQQLPAYEFHEASATTPLITTHHD